MVLCQAVGAASWDFDLSMQRYVERIHPVDAAIPPTQLRKLIELKPHHCRWPIGEGSSLLFCGARRLPKLPYCELHCRRAAANGSGEPGL